MLKRSLPLIALCSALCAAPAGAQMPDLSEEQFSSIVRFAMPAAFRGVQNRCAAVLTDSDYIFAQGDTLTARLEAAAFGQFEETRTALLGLTETDESGMMTMLAAMPAEALQPFIDEMIVSKIATDVKDEQCAQINHALELLDPLPIENLARLIGFAFVLSQADSDDAAEE